MALTARDIMESQVETVDAEMSLVELDRRFLEKRVGAFPVLRDGNVVGIVSRSDIVRQLSLEQSYAEILTAGRTQGLATTDEQESEADIRRRVGERIGSLGVASLMIEKPVSVSPSTPVKTIAEMMVSNHHHRLLVIEEGRLVGIVSSLDLAEAIAGDRLG